MDVCDSSKFVQRAKCVVYGAAIAVPISFFGGLAIMAALNKLHLWPFYVIVYILLLSVLLFCIKYPLPEQVHSPTTSEPHVDATWVSIRKDPRDTNYIVKQWHRADFRRKRDDYPYYMFPKYKKDVACDERVAVCDVYGFKDACNESGCNGATLIFYNFCMAGQWSSVLRRQLHCQKSRYFAHVKNADESTLSWSEEICPDPVTPTHYPPDIRAQMADLNEYLRANNLYLVDLHMQNIRSKDGVIKITDGEVVTPWEKTLTLLLYRLNQHNAAMVAYADFDRIYWANESRCPIDAIWSRQIFEQHKECKVASEKTTELRQPIESAIDRRAFSQ